MTLTRWLLILLAALTLTASGHDLDGTWKAPLPKGHEFKTFGEFVFDMKLDGEKLTGTVHMGSWPGNAPIADGKIAGDRASFTATGKLWSSSGYPKVRFVGTVSGKEMHLTVYFGYVGNESNEAQWDVIGQKVSDSR